MMADEADKINSKPTLEHDATVALEFLRNWRNDSIHNLVAIHPDTKQIVGITRPTGHPNLEEFIQSYQGWNLYFSVNEPRVDAPGGKLKKEHIAKVDAVFADMDAKGEDFDEARIKLFEIQCRLEQEMPPTCTIDSGGGLQHFWKLTEPIEAEQAERLGRGVAQKLGADPVQNVDRIMRLPGTINWPDEKKRSRGRVPTRATLEAGAGRLLDYETLAAHFPPADAPRQQVAHHEIDWPRAAEDLPQDLRQRMATAAAKDAALAETLTGRHEHHDDRSASDFRLAGKLQDHGFEPQQIAQMLWHYPNGKLAEVYHDNPNEAQRYFDRALFRSARPSANDDFELVLDFDPGPPPTLVHGRSDPADPEQPVDPFNPAPRRRLAYTAFDDIALPTRQPYIVKGLIDQVTMVVVYGDSGVGKTNVVLHQAFCVAAGIPFFDRPTRQGGVLYIAAEGAGTLKKRIAGYKRKYAEEIEGKRIPLAIVESLIDLRDPNADRAELVQLIRDFEDDFGVKCLQVVFDTLNRVMAGGNENSSEDMGAVVASADYVKNEAQTTTILVHHSGKDASKGARGHSSLRGATDTEIEITPNQFTDSKQRDMEQDKRFRWSLEEMELATDEEGDPIKTVLLIPEKLPAAGEFSEEIEEHAREQRAAIEKDVLGCCVLNMRFDRERLTSLTEPLRPLLKSHALPLQKSEMSAALADVFGPLELMAPEEPGRHPHRMSKPKRIAVEVGSGVAFWDVWREQRSNSPNSSFLIGRRRVENADFLC